MKEYQVLDPKLFKAFMAAAETENFTSAAARAHLTQSGVSQQIAKLEEQIGLPLFKRVKKSVVLTETGRRLAKFVVEQGYAMDVFLDSVKEQYYSLSGLVSYAMPPSCLFSPHFPMILKKRLQHPNIKLSVSLGPNRDIVHWVLEDRVDFGFITESVEHPSLEQISFCEEEYILVGSDRDSLEALDENNLLEYSFIIYPGVEIYYDFWLHHYFGHRKGLNGLSLQVSGEIGSIEGALKMVAGGLGLAVFPRHCVQTLLDSGSLVEYSSKNQPNQLMNEIFIIRLKDHPYPRRVCEVIDWFLALHS